jgi:crossover junction endodeoxyribonuclease RuvC
MIAGVDIGLSGAIAFLTDDGKLIESHDMPTMRVGDKNEIDEDRVREMFSREGLKHVFFEKAQAMPTERKDKNTGKTIKQGIASTAHYMASYGLVRGICRGIGVPYSLVHPATWKKAMMKDMPKEKSASTYRVQQLFPGCGLTRVKDHGRADAILIALYGVKYGVN